MRTNIVFYNIISILVYHFNENIPFNLKSCYFLKQFLDMEEHLSQ